MPTTVELHSSSPTIAAAGWDFQSDQPLMTLRCDAPGLCTLHSSDRIIQQWTDPLAALDWMAVDARADDDARWIGYLSYDLGRWFESFECRALDDLKLPLFVFSKHRRRSLRYSEEPGSSAERPGSSEYFGDRRQASYSSSLSRDQYLHRVARAIEYIRAGDVFQVNLSQRFTADLPFSPRKIWQNLLDRSPGSYGAFLDSGDHAIISNSPELFLHVAPDRHVITRPIKGTRPNQPGMFEQLQNSLKDRAELNMIVDLERNDLGRICTIGSVRVTQSRTIETHPTVYHGVATIEGQLRHEVTFVDLLRATFPGGSISGAPKIRAMQIIEELEPIRRGVYCGAIGYLAGDGSMQFNLAIRTMTAAANQIHIPVGGGIVADSDPVDEYEETLVKARAMFDALRA